MWNATRAGRSIVACAVLLAGFSAAAGAAEIGRVEGFGPVARGMAGAGVAHAVGAAASLLNPAELTRLQGERELMVQLTDIIAQIEVESPGSGARVSSQHRSNNRGPYVLPELAFAMRRGNWALGTGVFAAGGFGIEFGTRSFLSRTVTGNVDTGLEANTRAQLLRIPLALAWQPHARASIGLSVDVVNGSINLASLLDAQQVGLLVQQGRAQGSLVPVLAGVPDLAGAHLDFVRDNPTRSQLEAWGWSARLGLSLQLTPQTRLGLAYESETHMDDLDGAGRLTAVDTRNQRLVLEGRGRLPDFQFPQGFVVGVAHELHPALTVNADLRRTFWRQAIGETVLRFEADSGGDLRVSLPTGFHNLTTAALGVEWRHSPELTWRAGASHAFQQAVPDARLSAAFPTLTRQHLATGFSYRPSRAHQWDVLLSYGFTDAVRNPGGNVSSLVPITGRNRQINPGIGYSYRF